MAASGTCRKVSELLAEHREKKEAAPHYSFEYFMPRATKDVTLEQANDALVKLATEMAVRHHPLYLDLTWRGDIKVLNDHISLATRIQSSSGLPVMLHIAVSQLGRADCAKVLAACRAAGIVNIMALRGDPITRAGCFAFQPYGDDGFSCARDFVKFIRDTHGDFFCIAVAGYPGGHRSSEYNMPMELDYTYSKVRAGADLVVTQGCFEAEAYHSYITGLAALGCTVPVIPGILMFKGKAPFLNMARLCDIKLPTSWTAALEVKEPLAAGQKLVFDLVRTLRDRYGYHGFHLYTMNDAKPVIELFAQLAATPSTPSPPVVSSPSSSPTSSSSLELASSSMSSSIGAAPAATPPPSTVPTNSVAVSAPEEVTTAAAVMAY